MCKLSGLMTEAGPRPQPGAVRRWGEHVLQSFGADRVVWGSDWPVLELAGSYTQWWGEAQRLLAGLDAKGQAAVMGGNAVRLYRLDRP
jgi:L-fuconolactonase